MKTLRILLLIEFSREYGRDILKGIAKYSHLYGPWRFFNELQQERLSISQIIKLAPDGIFAQANEAKKLEEFLPTNIPSIVLCGDNGLIPGRPNISCNWQADSKLAAAHLLERGFKHFAFCGFDHCFWSRGRQEEFNRVISKAGFQVYNYKNKSKRYGPQELERICNWVKTLPIPIGLMACNDDRARHVLEACQIEKLEVPEQVAIIGVDNDPLRCDMSDPPLSSIAINGSAAGFEAAGILDRMMKTGKITDETIFVEPTHVHIRRSTDTIAVDDPAVASALRYICLNAKRPISVDEIAEAVSESRRNLERKFQKILKHSIMYSVRKERVNQISQILASTNHPISKIAMDFNMSSFNHFADYYKKETGMTPRDYRKKFGKILHGYS